jgi:hypothetical protein
MKDNFTFVQLFITTAVIAQLWSSVKQFISFTGIGARDYRTA